MGLFAAVGYPSPVLYTPPPAEQCVAAGLDWLMKTGPQYGLDYTRINPNVLDICSGSRCPLGQSSGGGYGFAMQLLGGLDTRQFNNKWLIEHGFLSGDYSGEGIRVRQLNWAWREVLTRDLANWAAQAATEVAA